MSYLSLWQRKGTPIRRMLFDILTGNAGETLYENTVTGNPATFKTAVAKALKNLVVPFESESGISGLTAYRTGVNLCAGGWVDGSISLDGEDAGDTDLMRSIYFPVKGGAAYYIVSGDRYKRVYWYDENKTFISNNTNGSAEKSAPNNAAFARVSILKATTNPDDYSFNFPKTDTDPHAYTGNSYAVTFPETVNAGSIDLVSGVLTVIDPESKTVQLDPVTIQTLIGANTVWTDTDGTNTAVFLDNTQHPVGLGSGFGSGFGNGNPDAPEEPEEPTDE